MLIHQKNKKPDDAELLLHSVTVVNTEDGNYYYTMYYEYNYFKRYKIH